MVVKAVASAEDALRVARSEMLAVVLTDAVLMRIQSVHVRYCRVLAVRGGEACGVGGGPGARRGLPTSDQ